MNSAIICTACGTYFPKDSTLPALCPICLDDRQYIPQEGQSWTSPNDLQQDHTVQFDPLFPSIDAVERTGHQQTNGKTSLYSLTVAPKFAISNRAILVRSRSGNILWDCIPLLNESTITSIKSMGGLKAIAISHPHFYSHMNKWAEVFDCPVYIHHLDAQWVVNKGPQINYWQGEELSLFDGMRVIHTGGHFPGSTVLSVPGLSSSPTVLCGDSLYVAKCKTHTAVMHSYPNQILLPRNTFAAFEKRMSSISFDSLIGAFAHQELLGNARSIYTASMQKYKEAYQL